MNKQNLFICILSHGVNSSKYDLELLNSKIQKSFNIAFGYEKKDDKKKDSKKEKKNSNHNSDIDNTIYCINSNCNSYIKSHSNIEILAKNLLNETKQNLENEIFPSFEKKILEKYYNSETNKNNISNFEKSNSTEKLNENKKNKYNKDEKKILYENCHCNLYISVLGHSLGGLILRYFIKLLYDKNSSINNNGSNDNSINDINEEIYNSLSFIDFIKQKHSYIKNIIPCSYISVATPHLGSCIPDIQTNIQLKSKLTNSFQSIIFSTVFGDTGRELNIPKNSLLGSVLWRNSSNNSNNSSNINDKSVLSENNQKINLLDSKSRTGSRLGLRLLLRKDSNANTSEHNKSNEDLSSTDNKINNEQYINDFNGIEALNNTEFLNKLEKFPCRTLVGCIRNDCFVRYVSALATIIDPKQDLQEKKRLIPDYKEDVKLISYSGFEEKDNDEMNAFYQKRLFEPKYPLNIVDVTTEKVEDPDVNGTIKMMIDELNEIRSKSRRTKNNLFDFNNIDPSAVYVDKENNNQYNLKLAKAINSIKFRRLTIDFQTYNYILQLMTHGLVIGKSFPCDSRTKELMNKMVNYLASIIMVDYLWISKQTNITLNNY